MADIDIDPDMMDSDHRGGRNNQQYPGSQKERLIFSGTPSQYINFNSFFVCFLIFLASVCVPIVWGIAYPDGRPLPMPVSYVAKAVFIITPFVAFYIWLRTYCHKYKITTERLHESEGILSRHTEVLEIYRIKDITLSEPLHLRVFGCANIILDTSDRSSPVVVIQAVRDSQALITKLRKNVERMRSIKGVREID